MKVNSDIMQETNKEPDEFSYHEAMDRTYMSGKIVEDMLTLHPVIKKHKDIAVLIDKALENIFEAYAKLGDLNFNKDKRK